MSGVTSEERVGRPLDVGRLSRRQPLHAVRGTWPAGAPGRRFLQYLAEFGALPVDLAARLMQCPEEEIGRMIERGAQLGWIRLTEYPGEGRQWASLRDGGRRRAGEGFGRRKQPSAGQLAHRREVIEAHLLLREEKSGWSWTCEAAFRECDNTGLTIPDGVLKRGRMRRAIEVERSRKLTATLRGKLERLCAEYDGVVYFGSSLVRTQLARLQSSGSFSKLEMRPLPSEMSASVQWPSSRDLYEPPPRARRVLQVINEEGIVFVAQLPRLLGWAPEKVTRVLDDLDANGCIRRGLESNGDGGWVWCNHRGANRSETGLPPVVVPSRGELVKRIVLTEVRLDALARWPESSWRPRRLLARGHAGKPPGLPRAVVERGGLRYAVMVLESWASPKKTIASLKRWEKEYAGVLCYRARKLSQWTEGLVKEHHLGWVEVRDLPKPPASAPYWSLEDEWHTGREAYLPNEEEKDLLRLINTEGLVSELQLPRALGRSTDAVERLVGPLADHNCLIRQNGWIRCNARGSRLSGTDMAPATLPTDGHLEQRFQLMEVRLSYGEPAALDSWKTIRQLGKERGAGAYKSQPNAAVRIEGEWHAVALFFREFRRKKLASQLKRWGEEYHRVRCYCREEDLEPFRRFIERYGLSSVDAVSFPLAPEGPARARQESFAAALVAEAEEREARERPKLLAQKRLRDAVRRGEVIKPKACQNGCHIEKPAGLHAHHEDYSRPLDVEWLCSKCHPKTHRRIRQRSPRRKAGASGGG